MRIKYSPLGFRGIAALDSAFIFTIMRALVCLSLLSFAGALFLSCRTNAHSFSDGSARDAIAVRADEASTPTAQIGGLAMIDDFEASGAAWFPDPETSALSAAAQGVRVLEGKSSIAFGFRMAGSNRAQWIREFSPPLDLGKMDAVLLDVDIDNTDRLQVSMKFWSDDAVGWQETPLLSVNPGPAADLRFELRNGSLSSAATRGRARGNLLAPGAVKRVALCVLGEKGMDGAVYADSLRIFPVDPGDGRGGKTFSLDPPADAEDRNALSLSGVKVIRNLGRTFESVELGIDIRAVVENPYDPEEAALDAVVTAPDGRVFRVPGFFYVPFARVIRSPDRETLYQEGPGSWRLRFTPDSPGRWSFALTAVVRGKKADAEAVSLDVSPSDEPGFVKASRRNPRMFAFSNGESFVPLGSNVGWYGPGGTADYERWFDLMSANGANYARVWMAPWGFAQEWSDTGLGSYAERQRQAWQLDRLFSLAEERGVYVLLDLVNHGQFSEGANPEWDRNPYNAALGGPIAAPASFITDPAAKKMFKRRLRYIVARWASSASLFCWEWWNEANLAGGITSEPEFTEWTREFSGYLRSIDPYGHLISTSLSQPYSGTESWAGQVDFGQAHDYSRIDWAPFINARTLEVRAASEKPFFFGEYGVNAHDIDATGIHFHNGLWAGPLSGGAGSAMIWWWDGYLEKKGLFGHYRGISAFLAGEAMDDPAFKPMARLKAGPADVYGLLSPERALLWVKDRSYSYKGYQNLAFSMEPGEIEWESVDCPVIELAGFKPGTYRLQRWNTATGEVEGEESAIIGANGTLRFAPGDIVKDAAFKVVKE